MSNRSHAAECVCVWMNSFGQIHTNVGHAMACPNVIGHTMACPNGIGHTVACPNVIGHTMVCPYLCLNEKW